MWLSVLVSVIAVGLTLAAIYFIYAKIQHPSVIFAGNRRLDDFVQDAYMSLIQSEPPPMFRSNKCSCTAGLVSPSHGYSRFVQILVEPMELNISH